MTDLRLPGEQPKFHTERLQLRAFEAPDAPTVQRLASAWELASTTLTIPHPYPEGGAAEWIHAQATAWRDGTTATFAVTDAATDEVVGAIGLMLALEHARGELGYWIGVPYWNRGYCTEAGFAMMAFAFDTLDLHRVQAHHFLRNAASGRVMQKLGMKQEGIHRGAFRRFGQFEDVAQYAILAEDWKGAR